MTKPPDRFNQLLNRYKNDPEYLTEGVLIDINEQVVRQMETLELNRTQLAQRLNVSNAYISKLLGGNENLTVKQLVRIAAALTSRIDVAIVPLDIPTQSVIRHRSTKPQTLDSLKKSKRKQLSVLPQQTQKGR